jgi:hypothetical protein
MPLVSMTTNLKSLRFGNDTVGGGNSNQPYIVTPIPEKFSDIGRTGGPDFLLRGGTLLPKVTVQDTSRLFKMFFDFRSPSGPLFIAKQNVLSLSNVNSSAGYVSWSAYNRSKSGNFFQRLGSAIGTFVRNNVAINQGIYTPLSTLGQAAGNSIGLHLNKQGLIPFAGGLSPYNKSTKGSPLGNTPLGLPTYLNTIASQGNEGPNSRLMALTSKVDAKTEGNNLYTYLGGPGAILGVGRTTISMLGDQRTGINNQNLNYTSAWADNFTYITSKGSTVSTEELVTGVGFGNGVTTSSTTKTTTKIQYVGSSYSYGKNKFNNPTGVTFYQNQTTPNDGYNLQLAYGASIKYFSTLKASAYTNKDFNNNWLDVSGVISPLNASVYQPGEGLVTNTVGNKLNSGILNSVPTQVFTQEQINSYFPASKDNLSFQESFTQVIAPSGSAFIPNTLDYVSQNIERRVSLGGPSKLGPGARGNLISYVIGKLPSGSSAEQTEAAIKSNSTYTKALDQITSFPLYQTTSLPPKETNDLVKFRIGVIDNDSPTKKTYIHFRAFIDSFSDQYTSDWDSKKFMGRGENFYKYNGFDRQISLSWTVAAQSKQELIPMYQKLNYLASACAPDYSAAGYMRGNLISLTVGGYCYEQVGIMKGITLDVPGESPWEIGVSDGFIKGTNFQELSSDASVKELPMIIKVSGFTFIPIHDFVPQVQQNKYAGGAATSVFSFKENKKLINGRFISNYGKEQYISLAAAGDNNYDGGNGNLNYIP